MNYGELRSLFLDILNRSDCTNTIADQYIGLGLRRVERLLRTHFQIETLEYVQTVSPTPIALPTDLMALKWVKVNGTTMRRASETDFDPDNTWGDSECFIIEEDAIVISPVPNENDVVTVSYYRSFENQVDDADTTDFSEHIPDLIVYAGLIYACDRFVDVRKPDFMETFVMLSGEVQKQADERAMSGDYMQIRNPYEGLV